MSDNMMMKIYMKDVDRHFSPWHLFFCWDISVSFPIILLKLAVKLFTGLFSDIVTEFT